MVRTTTGTTITASARDPARAEKPPIGTTISAAIASEFAESDGLHQSGLILLGLLLFVLTFFVLAAARLMLMRLEKKAGN